MKPTVIPLRSLYSTLFILLTVSSCAHHEGEYKPPGVYRIDIQQGNVVEQEMLDKLHPGMDKNQTRFIMGTPALVDPFHTNQWEYLYTFSKRGAKREQRRITIHFDESEKLSHITGDTSAVAGTRSRHSTTQNRIVDVPLHKRKKPGLFRKLINILPFVGDDKPKVHAPARDDASSVENSSDDLPAEPVPVPESEPDQQEP